MYKINISNFLVYKTLNSLWTGLSMGSVFILYQPLPPLAFSIGGIALAISSLLVSLFYNKILTSLRMFFIISICVELLILCSLLAFLFLGQSLFMALFIYSVYNITFSFGSYLLRAESVFLIDPKTLSRLDSFKQIGYLIGMGISSIFFFIFSYELPIAQVYKLHYILIIVQLVIVYYLIKSFNLYGRV